MEIMEVAQKALSLPQKAGLIRVVDQESFKAACEFREAIKGIQREIDNAFNPIITKAHQAHKEAIAQKTKAETPLKQALGIVQPEVTRYLSEQEDLRRKEEFRLREIARKAEEEAKLAEAAAYEAAGDKTTAEEIINEPIRVASVVLPKANLNSVIYMRETWSAEVVDMKALVQAIANGTVPLLAVEANMTVLNAQARTLKDGLNWPGVRAVMKKSIY
jgi:hypothetical protein